MCPCRATLVSLLSVLVLAHAARAATLHVPADYATIQSGIDAASAADTVLVAPGTYSETLQLRGGIVLKSSGGPQITIITYSAPVYAMITVDAIGPSSVLTGFTLEGADTIEKGLITDASSIEFSNNVVRNFWGIGLHFDGESHVRDCVVYHCGRAGIYAGAPTGYPTIEDCLLYDCGYAPYIASEAIGGHYGGGFVARRCTVVANHDGIVPGYRASIIEDCIVAANPGYGIYAWPGVSVTVTCSDLWGNGTDYYGMTPGQGCISDDPRFCEPATLVYTLDAASPCLPANNSCGTRMGAFGQGCGTTSEVLLSDDFNDGVIDPAKWSTPYGGIAEQGGVASMTARGYWITARELRPFLGPVNVEFDTHIPSGWDFLTIAVRSDGIKNDLNYGDVMNGVTVNIFRQLYPQDGYSVFIRNNIDGVTGPNIFEDSPYLAFVDGWFHVRVSYDYQKVSVALNDQPVASVPYQHTFEHNRICFYNREWGVTSYLDNVSITGREGLRRADLAPPPHGPVVQVVPNPFRQDTQFLVTTPSHSELQIFDVQGRCVRKFECDAPSAIRWDGRDLTGRVVSNGIYFYRLATAGRNMTGKLIHVR